MVIERKTIKHVQVWGRAFQVDGAARAKALRQECTCCV